MTASASARQQGCSYHDHHRLAHAGALERRKLQESSVVCVPRCQRLAIRTLSSLLAATSASCLPDRDSTPPNVGGTDERCKSLDYLLVSGDESWCGTNSRSRRRCRWVIFSDTEDAEEPLDALSHKAGGGRAPRRPTPISTLTTASASAAPTSPPTNNRRRGRRVYQDAPMPLSISSAAACRDTPSGKLSHGEALSGQPRARGCAASPRLVRLPFAGPSAVPSRALPPALPHVVDSGHDESVTRFRLSVSCPVMQG